MKTLDTYISDQLNSLPHITSKMKSQDVDKVQDKNFITENIGSGTKLKYKIIHPCFAVQDHIATPPPR
eukprot:15165213-Ditylum_brightwellii.AAC.1